MTKETVKHAISVHHEQGENRSTVQVQQGENAQRLSVHFLTWLQHAYSMSRTWVLKSVLGWIPRSITYSCVTLSSSPNPLKPQFLDCGLEMIVVCCEDWRGVCPKLLAQLPKGVSVQTCCSTEQLLRFWPRRGSLRKGGMRKVTSQAGLRLFSQTRSVTGQIIQRVHVNHIPLYFPC